MTPSFIAASLWVVAATLVAFLPIPRQILPATLPGLAGLAIPVWIGFEKGWLRAILGLRGFASLFRNGFKVLPALLYGETIEFVEE